MHMLLAANRYWLLRPSFRQQRTPSLISAPIMGTDTEIVKVTASILPAGGKGSPSGFIDVEIHLEIAEGWHINANPASQDVLIPTAVSLDSDVPAEVVSVNYPEGKIVHFDFSGESLSVYEGRITIPARIQLTSEDSDEEDLPLDFELRYQACNDEICLQPTTRKIRLRE